MESDDIEKIASLIRSMREDIAEFADEFEKLSDAQLQAMMANERQKAEEAGWKANSAETALQLRKLSAIFNAPQS